MKIFISFLVTVFLIAGQALADEDFCEGQVGAAYGLCNAYCNSLKCESEEHQASERACDALYDNYYRCTGEEPPCVVITCPCFTAEELIRVFADVECILNFDIRDNSTEQWMKLVYNIRLDYAWVGNYPSFPYGEFVGCGLLADSEVHVTDLSEEEILSCLDLLENYATNFCPEPIYY